MSAVTIRETIVTPNADGATVQLYISDAAREAEDAAIRLALTVSIPALQTPLLIHVQRAALNLLQRMLRDLDDSLGKELMAGNHRSTATTMDGRSYP